MKWSDIWEKIKSRFANKNRYALEPDIGDYIEQEHMYIIPIGNGEYVLLKNLHVMAESKDLGLFIGKMNIVNNRDAEFIEDEAKTVSFEAMGGDCDDIQKLICKWYERKDQTQFNKDEYTYLGAFKNKKGLIFDNVVYTPDECDFKDKLKECNDSLQATQRVAEKEKEKMRRELEEKQQQQTNYGYKREGNIITLSKPSFFKQVQNSEEDYDFNDNAEVASESILKMRDLKPIEKENDTTLYKCTLRAEASNVKYNVIFAFSGDLANCIDNANENLSMDNIDYKKIQNLKEILSETFEEMKESKNFDSGDYSILNVFAGGINNKPNETGSYIINILSNELDKKLFQKYLVATRGDIFRLDKLQSLYEQRRQQLQDELREQRTEPIEKTAEEPNLEENFYYEGEDNYVNEKLDENKGSEKPTEESTLGQDKFYYEGEDNYVSEKLDENKSSEKPTETTQGKEGENNDTERLTPEEFFDENIENSKDDDEDLDR